jgi:type VI secretion system protein ImpL
MQLRWEYLAAVALAIVILLLAWFVVPIFHLSGANALVLRAGIILLGVVAVIGLLLWARSHQPPLPVSEDRPAQPAAAAAAGGGGGAAAQDIDILVREAGAKVAAARLAAGATLSSLPAVFLLGETAAGKTSIMDQSGLDAELLAGQVFQENSIVPTRTANLWFARKTVFVEAGGPLMDDPASWVRLVKHFVPSTLSAIFGGGTKAPRAAVVCVDCEKLVREAALEKIVAQARKLRARLEELSYHLGISLPVYVVFSRSDRIPYFEEFAATFGNDEISQVFGSTLPLAVSTSSGVYAEQETRRLTSAFQGMFFGLAECRPGLLSRERSPSRQAGIYEFPREFGKLSKPLVQFLVDLCRPGHLRTGPFLRGFYFSGQRVVTVSVGAQTSLGARSASQRPGGFSADATSLINSQNVGANTSFGTSTSLDSPSESRKSVQRVFLSHVFSHVILQDRAALGASGASVRGDLGRRILFASIAVLALVWIIFTAVSFVGNAELVSSIRASANDLSSIQSQNAMSTGGIPGPQLPSLDSLHKLDNLRQVLVQLRGYDKNGVPLHLRWGLYTNSDDSLFNDARAIYFHAFDHLLFNHAKSNLLPDLQTYRGVPQPSADFGTSYNSLKAYLLITSDSARNNGEFLQDFLMNDWKRGLGDLDQDHSDLAAQQFAFYSSELTVDNPFSNKADEPLRDQVRAYLNAFSGLQRIYNSMLTDARQKAKAYRFSVAHPEGSEVLHARNDVDAAFTAEGWKIMDQSIQNPKAAQGEAWVLGSSASTNLSPAELSSQLRAMYDKDFIQQWRAFLSGSSVLGYASDTDAANKLRKLSANSSPLLALICDTSDSTYVSDPTIKQAFAAPQQVVSPGCGAQRKYDQPFNDPYMKGLLELQSCVQDVAGTPPEQKEPKKTQCLQTALQAQRNAGQMELVLSNDPDGHVDQMVSTLLEEPIKSLQRLWAHPAGEGSGGICGPFKALQSGYPFNAHSGREIALAEFNAFFQPGKGILSQFIAAQKNTLTPQGSTFLRALGSTTPIGPTFLRTLNELYAIQLAVYPNNANDPHLEYSVSAHLPEVGGFVAEKLAFDGQEWTITGAGGTKKFIWPGPVDQGATLTMNNGGSDIEMARYSGLWAVSHFFSGYRWQSTSSGSVIQGPLIGPTGQGMTSNGKPIEVRFDVDFKGVPFFQAGFLSSYACGPMNK